MSRELLKLRKRLRFRIFWYVLPHLVFAVKAWCPWTARENEVLERVRKRAVEMMIGMQGMTYKEKLKELDRTSLKEKWHQRDMVRLVC
jgi:hypothetical protein